MYDYLLPIGSVVKVKENDKLLMIIGILQKSAAFEGKVFDYLAVPYPEGRYDPRFDFGFDHKDIEEVLFKGYEDEMGERNKFMTLLNISYRMQEMTNLDKK